MLGTYRAVGDIDMATAPALGIALRDVIDRSDEHVVRVDCSGVTFMGSAGFHVLISTTVYAARRGHTLVIDDMSPSCTRLLQLCDVDHKLHVERSWPGPLARQ